MWSLENRRRHDRSKLRYPNDMTDDEWALIKPLIPPAKRGGQRRHIHPINRLPVGIAAERPSAAQLHQRLFLPLGL